MSKTKYNYNYITAAALIAELSGQKKILDVSIEEAGIDDIIRIAYQDNSRD